MKSRRKFWAVTGLVSACTLGCSGSNSGPVGGLGGITNSGGATNIGGASLVGGNTSAGGAVGSGGIASTGGTANGGGSAVTGGAAATGGIFNTGGTQATGGGPVTGGATATGGTNTTGGVAVTGGSKAVGGSSTSGGANATGGARATGGTNATGGSRAAGGTSTSGGATSAGGTAGTGGTCVPNDACTPTAPNTGDYYADCVTRVNQFRVCVCLGPLTRNTAAENCLNQEAQYDVANGAHAGFIANICTPNGNAQNECPAWDSTTQVVSQCILQMFQEGPPPTNPCTGSCYSTYGHYINMTGNYTQMACGYYTDPSTGKVTAVQNFFP